MRTSIREESDGASEAGQIVAHGDLAYTPREIVSELDQYVVGQDKAKKCVAIAMRNRWRRQHVQGYLRDEIMPNNIILIGPTGVGKTEIARRLARLGGCAFIKVEASKFTEVGYVGRDVESMIRDLVELSVGMVKLEKAAEVRETAIQQAEERLLDALLPRPKKKAKEEAAVEGAAVQTAMEIPDARETREKLRQQLRDGKLDERTVELELKSRSYPTIEVFSNAGIEEMDLNIQEAFGGLIPNRKKRKKVKVREAKQLLLQEEVERLVDMDKVIHEALERAQNSGIVFIDEIDKIVADKGGVGPDVSREGVQRDILPVIEGCSVPTKFGMVKTDHILFIAAGAFHGSKPSDLIPELQGRFPIRVELDSLSSGDFKRILREPRNALLKQYAALLETEGITLTFSEEGIDAIAEIAGLVNERTENIGARRLHTVLTILLEEILFEAPDCGKSDVVVTRELVKEKLDRLSGDQDLSRYIL